MDKNEIKQHWFDMPEFFQESQKEFQKITIRFQSEADIKAFEGLIGQKITLKTKSIWFPKLDRFKNKGVFYGD